MAGEQNPGWLGGLDCRYRGPNWNKQKQKALEQDNYTCQKCGIKNANLVVHHIRPYQLFDDCIKANDPSNLRTLCKNCHGIEEHKFIKSNPNLLQLRRIPKNIPPVKKCIKCNNMFQPLTYKSKACDNCMISKCLNCAKDYRVKEYYKLKTQKFCSPLCVYKYYNKKGIWPIRKIIPSTIKKMKIVRDQGMSYKKIAIQLGFSKYAVRNNLLKSFGRNAIQYSTTHVDNTLMEKMQILSNQGLSTRNIATRLGIGKSTVAKYLKNHRMT